MASFITGLVLETNNSVLLGEIGAQHTGGTGGSQEVAPSGVGIPMTVPCPPDVYTPEDVWAVPVSFGVLSGFNYVPYVIGGAKPDPQAIACVKLTSRNGGDYYIVVGTSAQYIASCEVCCNGTPAPTPVETDLSPLAPCFNICNTDADGLYSEEFGVPSKSGVQRYFPVGIFNGVDLAVLHPPLAAGYVSVSTLLAFLNASWNTVGTWTATVDNLTLKVTQADGPGTDTLCFAVYVITPSV